MGYTMSGSRLLLSQIENRKMNDFVIRSRFWFVIDTGRPSMSKDR